MSEGGEQENQRGLNSPTIDIGYPMSGGGEQENQSLGLNRTVTID